MANQLFQIKLDDLKYNIFRKNEKQKCIEVWEDDIWCTADRLLLCFNHPYCNDRCLSAQVGFLNYNVSMFDYCDNRYRISESEI